MKIGNRTATVKRLSSSELKRLTVYRKAGIFPVLKGEALELLRESLSKGYDESQPIVASAKTGEIVDGRNRRDIAVDLKLADVPVAFVKFANEAEVVSYIVQANLARRQLSRRDLAQLRKRLTTEGVATKQIAALTGVTERQVQRQTVAERKQAKAEQAKQARQLVAAGKSQRQIARELDVDERTVRRVRQNRPKVGNAAAERPAQAKQDDAFQQALEEASHCGLNYADATKALRLLVDLRKRNTSSRVEQALAILNRYLDAAGNRDPVKAYAAENKPPSDAELNGSLREIGNDLSRSIFGK